MTPREALQTALAGEHAAVYVFSVLGAQTSQSQEPDLFEAMSQAYYDHRALRDRLTAMLAVRGATPRAGEAAYALPNEAATPAQVRNAALVTERRLLAGYGQLVENTAGAHRAFAITALDASAVRILGFGARPTPYPGLEV